MAGKAHFAFLLPCLFVLFTTTHAPVLTKLLTASFTLFVLTEAFDNRAALVVILLSALTAIWMIAAPLATGTFYSGIIDLPTAASTLVLVMSLVTTAVFVAAQSAYVAAYPQSRLSKLLCRLAPALAVHNGAAATAAAARALLPPAAAPWGAAAGYAAAAVATASGWQEPLAPRAGGLLSDITLGTRRRHHAAAAAAAPQVSKFKKVQSIFYLVMTIVIPILITDTDISMPATATAAAAATVACAAVPILLSTPAFGARVQPRRVASFVLFAAIPGAIVYTASLATTGVGATTTTTTPLGPAATAVAVACAAAICAVSTFLQGSKRSVLDTASTSTGGERLRGPDSDTIALVCALASGAVASIAVRSAVTFAVTCGITSILSGLGTTGTHSRANTALAAGAGVAIFLTTRIAGIVYSGIVVALVVAVVAIAARGVAVAAAAGAKPALYATTSLLLIVAYVMLMWPQSAAWVDLNQGLAAAAATATLVSHTAGALANAGAINAAAAAAVTGLAWATPGLALVQTLALRVGLAVAAAAVAVVATAAATTRSDAAGFLHRLLGAPMASVGVGAVAGVLTTLVRGARVAVPAIVTATAFPTFAADEVVAVMESGMLTGALARTLTLATGLTVGGGLALACRAAAAWAANANTAQTEDPTAPVVGTAPSCSVAPPESESDGAIQLSEVIPPVFATRPARTMSTMGLEPSPLDDYDSPSVTPAPTPRTRSRLAAAPAPTPVRRALSPSAAAEHLKAVPGALATQLSAAAVVAGLELILLNTPSSAGSDLDPLIATPSAAALAAGAGGVVAGTVLAALFILGFPLVVAAAGRGRERVWPIALYGVISAVAVVTRALIGSGVSIGATILVLVSVIGLGLVVALRQPGAAVALLAALALAALLMGRPDVHAYAVLATLVAAVYSSVTIMQHDARRRERSAVVVGASQYYADGTQTLMTFLGAAAAASSAGFSAVVIVPLSFILLLGPSGSWNLVAIITPITMFLRCVVETGVGFVSLFSTLALTKTRTGGVSGLHSLTKVLAVDTILVFAAGISIVPLLLARPGSPLFRWSLRAAAIPAMFTFNATSKWFGVSLVIASFVCGAGISSVEDRNAKRAADAAIARIHSSGVVAEAPRARVHSQLQPLQALPQSGASVGVLGPSRLATTMKAD